MEQRVVTVIGGTGFVGRYVVRQLAAAGFTIRVISRHPDAALHLKTAGSVGQIVLMRGDIAKPQTLAGKIEGSYAVVNLAGILFPRGNQTFSRLHSNGPKKLAQAAKAAGVQRFIHVSALGVDHAPESRYAKTKLKGEQGVLEAFPEATILRPSVIFGPEDNFYNQFAAMAMVAPALPLIGGGNTRFQPVYVADVARAVEACLVRPDSFGCVYELGGPQIYTFRVILKYILQTINQSCPLIPVPLKLASILALFCEILPKPPLTRDQVKLLKHDNVVSHNFRTFAHLGISPTAVEMIVPQYLARFHKKPADTRVAA